MESQKFNQVYGYEARVQLSFNSYMKIAALISFTFAIVITILLRAVVIIGAEPGIDGSTLDTWIMGYMFVGFFITSLISSAISFVIYSLICAKQKGHRVTGRFSVLVSRSDK
ncbi:MULTISPECIES: hypothetical protein [Shewanella]|uniref:Uncharacterized protein n=1 Tax=Shewanella psychromarinicola TaxID=2487742 RepID=A0A3N4EBV2_9GAMM|nr:MULTISPECIES: hypothetical protein [Shewanella]AZG36630.1 hypothetical protein EGC80_18365 [Shewanella psychromarinicola]MCL1083937.1 hypothetical protein [Shewanella psychromarinicola]PKG77856.1 hypothetical protein CXF80_05750 [Shewanella sp. Actino-trap-3]RPA34478.1 hypothetical protein EGC77_02005 [Shewanella psychromarinicola]